MTSTSASARSPRRSRFVWVLLVISLVGLFGYLLVRSGGAAGAAPPSTSELRLRSERSPSVKNLVAYVDRLISEDQRDEALAVAQRAVELHPGECLAHNSLGVALAATGQPIEARAEFAKAVKLDPRRIEPYVNLGRLAMLIGDQQRAMLEYDRATAIDPTSASAWRGLGQAAASLQNGAQATAAFKKAIALEPDRPEPYADLGVFLAELGRGDEAREHLHRAVSMGYRTGKLYAGLAMVYADQPETPEDLPKALEYADEAARLGDDSTLLAYARGLALQRLERYDDAIVQFKSVVARSQNANGGWIGLSQCYRALGKSELAEEAAQKGEAILNQRQRMGSLQHQIRANPDRLDARREYAEVLMENGQYLLAADQYRYIAQHTPEEPREWLKAADAFEKGSQPKLAAYLRGFVQEELAARRRGERPRQPDSPALSE